MKYYYAPPSSLAASSHLFLRAAGEVAVVVDLLPSGGMHQWQPEMENGTENGMDPDTEAGMDPDGMPCATTAACLEEAEAALTTAETALADLKADDV